MGKIDRQMHKFCLEVIGCVLLAGLMACAEKDRSARCQRWRRRYESASRADDEGVGSMKIGAPSILGSFWDGSMNAQAVSSPSSVDHENI